MLARSETTARRSPRKRHPTPEDGGRVILLPTDDAIEAEKDRRSLRRFVRGCWHVIQPRRPFVPGWHIDAICDHLEAVSAGQIRDLLINMPPRHAKSTIVSVIWPVWEWISAPGLRFLFFSHGAQLATRDCVASRRLILSPWFQARYGSRFHLSKDQNQKTRYENNHAGYRVAFGLDSGITGEGGDRIVGDDPHSTNPKKIESPKVREHAVETWKDTISNRAEDPRTVARVIVMQRTHHADVSGACIAEGGWQHLMLPAEYEPARAFRTALADVPAREDRPAPIGKDPRTKAGELLWRERFGPDELARTKRTMSTYAQAGQLQQNPTPSEGGIFKRSYWRFHLKPGQEPREVVVSLGGGAIFTGEVEARPKRRDMDRVICAWDMNFKKTADGSYVVGVCVGVKGARRYVLDRFKERCGYADGKAAILAMAERWAPGEVFVEAAANGHAILEELAAEVEGLIAVDAGGGKDARAHAAEPGLRAGQWSVPIPQDAEWVPDFIESLAAFPRGEENDTADAVGHAARQLGEDPPDFV